MDAMAHRGPDQAGSWTGPSAILGHRRLSIIDLSEDGRQPMTNEDGSVLLVFNGEVYNFAELRCHLAGRHRFRSHTDSEVLIHGYEEWGIEGLLRRLSGMFAFALWDDARGVLHLARDRVGKKPLHYARTTDGLAFASTLPSLLALLPTAPEVDPRAVADYLVHLCVPGDGSIVRGVRKLPPGHRAEFRAGELTISPYWRLSFAAQEERTVEEWEERIDAEVRRAVRERLVSDVPLGVFLSGGVDSSLVAALMAQESPGRITTISAGFLEREHDESAYARRVAEHLGSDHHELVLRPEDTAILPRMIHAIGEPFADQALLPTMYLARAARGIATVVLTGDGGDESFAGYATVLAARLAGPYRALVPTALRREAVPELLRRLEGYGGRVAALARQARNVAVPSSGSDIQWRFDPLGRRGFRGRLDGLLHPGFAARIGTHDPDAHWRNAWSQADGPTDVDRVLHTELATLLPDMFLAKTDAATMAFGVEARSPLLDSGVVELASRIPAARKLPGLRTKYLLKRLAARYVPREVVYRRKHGFSVPTGEWMRGPLGGVAADVLLSERALGRGIFSAPAVRRLMTDHREGRADHGQRIWTLLQLELWMQMFLDRSVRSSDTLFAAPAEAAV